MWSKMEIERRRKCNVEKLPPVMEVEEARHTVFFSTFGDTSLAFLNVLVADAKQAVEMVKRIGNRKYLVKMDGRGLVSIEYDHDDTFTVALFNKSRWVTNIKIKESTVNIGNIAQARPTEVATRHVTKKEDRAVHATFTLKSTSEAMLKRVDVRGHNTQWFSVFSHGADLLAVRPNGDYFGEKFQYLTDQMATQVINNYRRTQGQDVLPSDSTVVMRRRKALATSIAQKTVDTQTDDIDYAREMQLVAERKSKYEEELAELRAWETQLREEKQSYEQQKQEICQGLVEVGRAGIELATRRNRLQEEKKQFETEQQEFEKLKRKTTEQGTQSEQPLWTSRQSTSKLLTHRFTLLRLAEEWNRRGTEDSI